MNASSYTIQYNGSHWAGEPADSLETLLERLQMHTLNEEMFEHFCHRSGETYRFFGNFEDVSAVFRIDVYDPEMALQLSLLCLSARALKSNH